jgi:capsular polysaccharide transport system permease protein
VKYLHRMVSVNYDTSSQIITVAVQAFTPQDASRLAQEILALSNDLVNQVSAKSRQDTVRLAESELQRAEARLREQRDVLSTFRETEQDIDPAGSVATQQAMIGRLMGELTGAQTRMATLREYLSDDAPSVRVLASLISTLEDQVAAEKAKLGRGDAAIGSGDTLTERVGTFEELSVDLEFTRRAYLSALVSVEGARLEADRQQRYLASFVSPSLPEQALYPKRVLNVFLAAILAFMLWGIAVMSVYIVREHMT